MRQVCIFSSTQRLAPKEAQRTQRKWLNIEPFAKGFKDEDLTHTIIAAAIEVNRTLGPGLLEEEEDLSQGEVLPF